jgi:hypothetical protein
MSRKSTITYIILILIILILVLIAPYYIIRNNVSLDNETLSSLGSYISGGVSILNLFVFVYLTMLIARYENLKSTNEIKTQKIILQSQFRQSELEKFVTEIEKPFDTSQPSGLEQSILRYMKAHLAVNNFINQNQYLFPLLRDPTIFDMGKQISISFAEMHALLEKDQIETDKEKFEEIFLKVIDQKDRFVHLLRAFIISELES